VSPSQRPTLMTVYIASVDPTGSVILAQDALGKEWTINGLNRPKGTGLPSVGETWLADHSSGQWLLVRQYNCTPLDTVTDLPSLIKALAKMGLVINGLP
jgi:hypothetical protein